MCPITYAPPLSFVYSLVSRSLAVTIPTPLSPCGHYSASMFPGSRCPSAAHTFNPGLLMTLSSPHDFFVPPTLPLPVWSQARMMSPPVSVTAVSFWLPPHIRFPMIRPSIVVLGPPTVLLSPYYGLCMWSPTESP